MFKRKGNGRANLGPHSVSYHRLLSPNALNTGLHGRAKLARSIAALPPNTLKQLETEKPSLLLSVSPPRPGAPNALNTGLNGKRQACQLASLFSAPLCQTPFNQEETEEASLSSHQSLHRRWARTNLKTDGIEAAATALMSIVALAMDSKPH